MGYNLSPGAIQEIFNLPPGSKSEDISLRPILQVLSVRIAEPKPGQAPGPKRYRIVLSDGTNYIMGVLGSQNNSDIESGRMAENIFIQLNSFMRNTVKGRCVLIVLNLSITEYNPGHRIGQPTDVDPAPKEGEPGFNEQQQTNTTANTHSAPVSSGPMYERTNVVHNNPYGSASGGGGNNAADVKPNIHNPYPSPPKSSHNPYGNSNSANRYAPPIAHSQGTPGGSPITLISQLNMYQSRWTIKARVVSKSDIRTWSNAKGEGSLFSIELLDSSGVDIRATLFKEAVDKFYNFLNVGSVYQISGGRLKVANRQYNSCKSQMEITLDQKSEIHLQDDTNEIQAQSFDLVKIADIEQVEENKNVDVLGVVQEVGEVATILSKKSGQELQKCEVTIVDDTAAQIRVTLWGKKAVSAKEEIPIDKVVAFRRARVSDYGGKSLSGGDSYIVEPQIPETAALQQWWAAQNGQVAVKSLSSSGGGGGKMDSFADRKSVADIKNLGLGYNNPKGDYISFKATINFLKKDKEGGAWYTACPNKEEPCKNRCKVTQTTDGNWQCDRCHGTFPECTRKWIFSGVVIDDTSSTWVSFFNEQAMDLFGGATADEVFAKYDDQDFYDSHFLKATNTEWILRCRVKTEMVNEEERIKTQVVRMDPVDYAAESRELIKALQNFQ